MSRLDAYLAEHGFYASRRIAKEAIQGGLVKVMGKTALKPSAQVPDLPGLPGLSGAPGHQILPEVPEQRGLSGSPGLLGHQGLPEFLVQQGLPGAPGLLGQPGQPGQPELPDQQGLPGAPELPGRPVHLAQQGLSGQQRLSGLPEAPGQPGLPGVPELPGQRELPGGVAPLIEAAPFAARFVSRGGDKLSAALDAFGIGVAGAVALDVGASTGGFTDCLLQRGAAFVYAIDAGSGQLHEKLASHPRVMSLEKTNARHLRPRAVNGGRCSLAVIDVSFISLEKILLPVSAQLLPGSDIVCLVKPQFEVGPANVGKNGIVKDAALHAEVIGRVELYARSIGLLPAGRSESPILGGDGNREFFLRLSLAPAKTADHANPG
jgi:23S rRNA (cytidine1920-2'-O)/16S rRNA (cytidine1409-2'-O)-methyltransferase